MTDPDYVAKAKAAINEAGQTPAMIAAVIGAQAIDRQVEALRINSEALDNLNVTVTQAAENAWRIHTSR